MNARNRDVLIGVVTGLLIVAAVTVYALGQTTKPGPATQPTATTQPDLSGDVVPHRILLHWKQHAKTSDKDKSLKGVHGRKTEILSGTGVHVIELPPNANEAATAHALGQQVHVDWAEVDRVVTPDMIPNDYWWFGINQTQQINCSTAWDTTTGSRAIIIAICDTGVARHPDLIPNTIGGWNVYDNNADATDPIGHGTAVAGAACAAGNNTIGTVGIAFGCRLMPIRIGNQYGASSSSLIAKGIIWAADHGANVVNVSYGISGSATVSAAAAYLRTKGGLVTVAAGNDGIRSSLPADPNLIAVGGVDVKDTILAFSTKGDFVDVLAPGVSVWTTMRNGGYGSGTGTSFAAPIVAGVLALELSANPALTPAQAEAKLKQSCLDLGAAGYDPIYAGGRVDAARAVAAAKQ